MGPSDAEPGAAAPHGGRFEMSLSLGIALVMLAGKSVAYGLTGSVAILSDAFESIVHLFATSFAAFAFWYSAQPADADHPYGHGKIAYLSAGFEGALILSAAAAIVYTSVQALISGGRLRHLTWGLAITAGLGLVNLVLGLALVAAGRRQRSIVLEANGRHVLTDMWTSLGVVLGVGLVWLTDLRWLDPLTGLVVGLQIVYTAVKLLRSSFHGLMERADPAHSAALTRCLEQCVTRGEIAGFHQLRHRAVDGQLFVEVHLLVPGQTPTAVAHSIATGVEQQMRAAVGSEKAWITTHVEPANHVEAHPGGHRGADPLADT